MENILANIGDLRPAWRVVISICGSRNDFLHESEQVTEHDRFHHQCQYQDKERAWHPSRGNKIKEPKEKTSCDQQNQSVAFQRISKGRRKQFAEFRAPFLLWNCRLP